MVEHAVAIEEDGSSAGSAGRRSSLHQTDSHFMSSASNWDS
jgi:hypothetical protein